MRRCLNVFANCSRSSDDGASSSITVSEPLWLGNWPPPGPRTPRIGPFCPNCCAQLIIPFIAPYVYMGWALVGVWPNGPPPLEVVIGIVIDIGIAIWAFPVFHVAADCTCEWPDRCNSFISSRVCPKFGLISWPWPRRWAGTPAQWLVGSACGGALNPVTHCAPWWASGNPFPPCCCRNSLPNFWYMTLTCPDCILLSERLVMLWCMWSVAELRIKLFDDGVISAWDKLSE